MPIVTPGGTRIGPVSIICATIVILSFVAGLTYLIHGSATPDDYLRPIVSGLFTLGTGAIIYWRTHANSIQNREQNSIISSQVADVKQEAVTAKELVVANAEKLDGGMDKKIEDAVARVLEEKGLVAPVLVQQIKHDLTIGDPPEGKI